VKGFKQLLFVKNVAPPKSSAPSEQITLLLLSMYWAQAASPLCANFAHQHFRWSSTTGLSLGTQQAQTHRQGFGDNPPSSSLCQHCARQRCSACCFLCSLHSCCSSSPSPANMLAARTTPRLARGSAPAVQRCVRVNAFKPVSTQGLVAAVAAGSLLLVSPS
jgi:hypothetical protein